LKRGNNTKKDVARWITSEKYTKRRYIPIIKKGRSLRSAFPFSKEDKYDHRYPQ
jgi:hypothetical protein